jgi:hypothetical protein
MNFIAGLNAVASIFQPFAAFGFTLAMHPMQRELSVDTIVNAQKEVFSINLEEKEEQERKKRSSSISKCSDC